MEPSRSVRRQWRAKASSTLFKTRRKFCEREEMARRFLPLLNRVLVQKIEAPSKSVGGILLPETASKVNEAQVIAVGPGSRAQNGELIPVSLKEGDKVLLPEYGGQSLKLEDTEYFIYRDEEVLGVLTE